MATVALCPPSANFSTTSPPPPPSPGPDSATFRAFYRMHAGFVRRVLSRCGVPSAEIEDVAQEVFLVAVKRWATLDLGDVRRWLYVVAVQLAANHRSLARYRRETLSDKVPEGFAEGYDPEKMDTPKLVERALKRLGPKFREVFVRFVIHEELMQQIASDLGIPEKTGYARVELARAKIGRMFR